MRSAHTQRCHESKACTSPATTLSFSQNKQPQRQRAASARAYSERTQAEKGDERGRAVVPILPPPLRCPTVRYCWQAFPPHSTTCPLPLLHLPPSPLPALPSPLTRTITQEHVHQRRRRRGAVCVAVIHPSRPLPWYPLLPESMVRRWFGAPWSHRKPCDGLRVPARTTNDAVCSATERQPPARRLR